MIEILYLYDEAIVEDLKASFTAEGEANPSVTVVAPDQLIEVVAQLQNDQIKLPVVALARDLDTGINTELTNFTMMHKGIQTVIDPKTNLIYNERAIPVNLSYHMSIVTSNTADMDELIRELIFKYVSQYFIPLQTPYEGKRKIHFGVVVDHDGIETSSNSSNYLEAGQLHQSIIPLRIEGAVMLHYTPVKLKNTRFDIDPSGVPQQGNK